MEISLSQWKTLHSVKNGVTTLNLGITVITEALGMFGSLNPTVGTFWPIAIEATSLPTTFCTGYAVCVCVCVCVCVSEWDLDNHTCGISG